VFPRAECPGHRQHLGDAVLFFTEANVGIGALAGASPGTYGKREERGDGDGCASSKMYMEKTASVCDFKFEQNKDEVGARRRG
jgi:hypothetical protein